MIGSKRMFDTLLEDFAKNFELDYRISTLNLWEDNVQDTTFYLLNPQDKRNTRTILAYQYSNFQETIGLYPFGFFGIWDNISLLNPTEFTKMSKEGGGWAAYSLFKEIESMVGISGEAEIIFEREYWERRYPRREESLRSIIDKTLPIPQRTVRYNF